MTLEEKFPATLPPPLPPRSGSMKLTTFTCLLLDLPDLRVESAYFARRLHFRRLVSNHTKHIAGFHCHAIKIKIENHSLNEVKKLTRYRP